MAQEREEQTGSLRRDGGAALLALTAAAGLAVVHFAQGGRLHRDQGLDPGPALVPELLLMLLALLGGILLAAAVVRSWRQHIQPVAAPAAATLKPFVYPVGLLVSLALYMAVLHRTGFIVASAVLAVVWSILLAAQTGRRLSALMLVFLSLQGVAITALIYLVFRYLLRVPLP